MVKRLRTICPITTSNGWPCFSYSPNSRPGSMAKIITRAAALVGTLPRRTKKSGKPIRSAAPKHTICRFVRPNSILLFTWVKSLGTDT